MSTTNDRADSDWEPMGFTIRQRYETDASFRQMVNMMQACIEQGQFTPTEIREGAMLAQILYEERHLRPIVFSRDDVIRGKV